MNNYKNSIKISVEKVIAIFVVIATVAATFFAVVNSNQALAHDIDPADTPLVSIQKTVMNVTQNTAYSEQVDADFGDTVKFRLEIKNTGNIALTDLKVTDVLPSTLTYVPATMQLTGGHVFHGNLTDGLSVSDLENHNDSMTITFEATIADQNQFEGGEQFITNEATVVEEGGTPSSPDSGIAKIRIFKAVSNINTSLVSIQKTVMNVTQNTAYSEQVDADFGDTVKFKLEIKNTGNIALTDLKVNDVLPQNLSFVSGSLHLTGGHVFHGNLTDGLSVSDLENHNDSMTITFEAIVADQDHFTEGEQFITNEATVVEEGGTPSQSVTDIAKVRVFKDSPTQCTAPVVDDNTIETVNGTVGQSLSYNLSDSVHGGSQSMTFTLADSSSLPDGVTLNNGVINGTPTAAATSIVKFFVENSCGREDFKVKFVIDEAPTQCTAPVVDDNTIETVNGTVGQSFNYSLSESVYGGSQPMTFTLADSSSLPDGITLNNGVLSGIPEDTTSTVIKFFVENTCGREDFKVKLDIIQGPTQCVDIEVDDSPIKIADGMVGKSFSYDLSESVTEGSRPITFTLVHSSLPGGLSINGDLVSGTPTVTGTTTFKFFAENACSREDFKVKFIITENDGINTPPSITLIGENPLEITVNTNFIDPGATAMDTEDGDLTSQIVKSGTVNASTTGTYIINYSVTDSGGLSATTSRTVIVNPAGCTSNCGGGGSTNTPPVITLIGDNPLVIILGNDFVDPGATANDTQDGDLTSQIVVTGTVSTSTLSTSTLTYTVTDSGGLSASTTRQVVVRPADNNPPSNPPTTTDDNGGGGSSGGRRRDISNLITGEVLGATSCSYLKDYLKIDWKNDPIEVLKIQSFLNVFEKENLSLTGVYNQATFDAVSRFQTKYSEDILVPWGPRVTTGFTYILTKKKVNEIYCNTIINLSAADQQEISSFRSYLQSLGSGGVKTIDIGGSVGIKTNNSTNVLNDVLNNSTSSATTNIGVEDNLKTSVVKNVAISLFALPQKWFNLNECRNISLIGLLLLLILILLVITLLLRSRKSNRLVGASVITDNIEGSPVIVLPGIMEDKNDTLFEPGEEIIIENPEEVSDEIVDEKVS